MHCRLKGFHGLDSQACFTLDISLEWCISRGVQLSDKERECRTGCDSLHSIAVYLRFQLPPMHLANRDSVVKEMQSLMDVSGKNAMSIIDDLNVKGAQLAFPNELLLVPVGNKTVSFHHAHIGTQCLKDTVSFKSRTASACTPDCAHLAAWNGVCLESTCVAPSCSCVYATLEQK